MNIFQRISLSCFVVCGLMMDESNINTSLSGCNIEFRGGGYCFSLELEFLKKRERTNMPAIADKVGLPKNK